MTTETSLYVTCTETLYPSETQFGSVVVRLYGRTPEGERQAVTVRGFKPYFLTTVDDADKVAAADHEDLLAFEDVDTTPLSERYYRDTTELVKVVTKFPRSVPNLRKHFGTTWGADTLFTERFRIDHGVQTGVTVPAENGRDGHIIVDADDVEPCEMHDVAPRVVTLDIETDDRASGFPAPGEARVLSIAVHDSHTDDTRVFLDLDGETPASFFGVDGGGTLSLLKLGLDELDALVPQPSERKMLDSFASFIDKIEPDIIAGWNSGDESSDGFDLPHIIERMRHTGASPGRLSPERSVDVDNYGSSYEPSIVGRSLYDLMDGWTDIKVGNVRSQELDHAASVELDDAKIAHEDMGYFEMYEKDPQKFVNYNAKDTRLTVAVNDSANILGQKKRNADMVGVDFRRSHENNEYIEMAVRRKCHEYDLSMITKYDNEHVGNDTDGVNYEGAYVFPSFNGVKENVCGVDLSSLYPMTQWMLNASPDARIDVTGHDWYALKDELDGQYVVAENGQKFRTDHDGIIRELVDEYRSIKSSLKEKRNQAEYGTEEWEDAAESYASCKTIYNSFYGYSGWARSPLYNPHTAAAITLTGQRVIKKTAQYIDDNTPAEVVYGDTDSNYVEFPHEWDQKQTLTNATEICDTLSNEVYPKFCSEFNIDPEDNRWDIGVEMRAENFLMIDKKKRYSYLKVWDEGDALDSKINDGDGKFAVTGFECVKSNFSQLTKETQERVLEQIVRGADNSEIVETVHQAAASIDAEDPDWGRIGVPQALGQKIDPEKAGEDGYYSWSSTSDHPQGEPARAAWFANHLLDVELSSGDKPMRAALKPTKTVHGETVDVISYKNPADLDGVDLRVDATEMQRKCIRNPMKDILQAVGIPIEPALVGITQNQKGLGQFI